LFKNQLLVFQTVTHSVSELSLVGEDGSAQNSEADNDCSNDKEWREKEKHVFILSSAGKPIYSRYGLLLLSK